MNKEKIKAFYTGKNQQTAALECKQTELVEQRQHLRTRIDALEQALDHPKDYKWYQLSAKINDKHDAESRLRAAKKELKEVENQIEELEQKASELRNTHKKRRIWATFFAAFLVFIVLVCAIDALKAQISSMSNTPDDELYAIESITEGDIQTEITEPETKDATVTETTTKVTNKTTAETSTQPATKSPAKTTAKTTKAKQITTKKKEPKNTATTQKSKSKRHTTTKQRYIAPEDKSSSETVYITNTGSKYHRSSCRFLKSKHAISKKAAIRQGYQPCGTCNP